MMSNESLFNDHWLKLQQDYWQGLANMSSKALGLDAAGAQSKSNPWQAAMDQWWRAMSPAAPDPARDFMQRLMDQGKSYFGIAEQMTRGLSGADAAKGGWEALTKTFDDMQKAFSGGFGDQGDAQRRMMGFWEMPLDNWQRMMSSMSPMMPGDLLRNMPHGPMQGSFDRVLSAPGLGYSREEQAQYQDLTRRALDYQRALQDYAGFFNQLGLKSVQRMRDFVQARAEEGKTIDSVRDLYDSWISCCEEVYGEEVSTPEYARIHGQLVNADMALKKRLSVMVDENLGALNMPTRSELRTLQDRLQETRRENKKLRHDLDLIKRRLSTLPTGSGGSETSAGGPVVSTADTKKTPVRKKTAVRGSTS